MPLTSRIRRGACRSTLLVASLSHSTHRRQREGPALPSFTSPKILWVRQHEPSAFSRASHLLLPKDYVRHRLSGTFAIDVADGSGTGLLDVSKRTWSDDVVGALEVPRGWLPEVFESPTICAKVNTAGASATGLRQGTPIVAGAGDQAAEAVGLGAVRDGEVSVAIGTSGVVFVSFNLPRIDRDGRLHSHQHTPRVQQLSDR